MHNKKATNQPREGRGGGRGGGEGIEGRRMTGIEEDGKNMGEKQ